jgi:phosphoribosylaminoimidazolecarboxamide formyltransferase/IMP cyclohydrolase
MSFNNLLDSNAAVALLRELACVNLAENVAVFVKHGVACGVGLGPNPVEAYRRAYLGDPGAAFGGVLAVGCDVDDTLAAAVMESLDRWGRDAGAAGFFVEVWAAPSFTPEAIELIQHRKKWGDRVRLVVVKNMLEPADPAELDVRKLAGSLLVQTPDAIGLNEDNWTIATRRAPTDRELHDLRLAWLICKHTRSNAITLCRDGMLIGNGAGQTSRVMSCRIATWLAKDNGHANAVAGAVAASDAFFPFRDGPDLLAEAGVTAIIQPGGSKRDHDVVAACDQRGIAMILTGVRHFRH